MDNPSNPAQVEPFLDWVRQEYGPEIADILSRRLEAQPGRDKLSQLEDVLHGFNCPAESGFGTGRFD